MLVHPVNQGLFDQQIVGKTVTSVQHSDWEHVLLIGDGLDYTEHIAFVQEVHHADFEVIGGL